MRLVYHSVLSPASRKLRMLLREKNIPFEVKEEPFWERREAFVAVNPASSVPVLVEDNGMSICGGYACVEYVEEAYPEKSFTGRSLEERAEVRRLTSWFDEKFYEEVSGPLLMERHFKRLTTRSQPDSECIRAAKANIVYHLSYIAYLSGRRGWLAGDNLSLADFSAAAHISCLDYFGDVPWDEFPAAREWYSIMKSRPSLRALLIERIPVVRPPEYYEDPDF